MTELRAVFEALGYGDVRTLLGSGNVVFVASRARATAPMAEAIETAVAARTGVSARVTLVTATDFAAIVAENPLAAIATDPARLLVAVYRDAAIATALEPLARDVRAPDVLVVGKRAAYLWCPGGALSGAWETMGKRHGDAATSRNWTTMLKLQALLRESGAG